MLARESWLPAALALGLEVGQQRRVDHDCGPGRTLKIARDEKGYIARCHRCNDWGSHSGPPEDWRKKAARLTKAREADQSLTAQPPQPEVREVSEWPVEYQLWMYKAGLGRDLIGKLGAWYHPPTDRVVVPVYEGERLVYWQARSETRSPKWLGPATKPATLIPRWGTAVNVTLCEDMLSAFKVGLDHEGWAVTGTSVSDHMMAELLRRGTTVNLALDPDPAGQKAAAKYGGQLRAYGLDVRNIVLPSDPKRIPRQQLKEYLHVRQ